MARAELQRLRTDARAGHLRRLYVFRLDRLTRSGIRDTFELIEELRGYGVDLVSVADGFDLNGPAAEVVLAVMAWAAKMERIAINESAWRPLAGAGVGPGAWLGTKWPEPRRCEQTGAASERSPSRSRSLGRQGARVPEWWARRAALVLVRSAARAPLGPVVCFWDRYRGRPPWPRSQ